MTHVVKQRRFGGQAMWALAGAVLVAGIFVAANTHLVMVSFRSQPDCVLHPAEEGAASYRAATSSC